MTMTINRRDFLKLAGMGGVVFASGLGYSAVRNGAGGAERDCRVARAGVDEHIAFRIGRHAGRFTHVDVVRELQRIGRRVELNLGNSKLGR